MSCSSPVTSFWHRPMVARRADEQHRASTMLELFFDLCFVAAVAHTAGHGHISDRAAAAAYTVPVAVFITLVRLLHHRSAGLRRAADVLHPVAVLAVLAATFAPSPILTTGIIAALLIAATLLLGPRRRARVRRPLNRRMHSAGPPTAARTTPDRLLQRGGVAHHRGTPGRKYS
ncbi:hypothetical protein [Streptomyces sp. A0958]|uniref:hypothetical protein n=1 Tax=Streptomyces sp. A0958 TaxID=2563101 RepID=UPI001F118568|nr:hypothetical protein [Streptomyces sp. A0958]